MCGGVCVVWLMSKQSSKMAKNMTNTTDTANLMELQLEYHDGVD